MDAQMFDDLEGAFDGMEDNYRIPISIPLDDEANLDRVCPSNNCGHTFKVLFDDWEAKVLDDCAYCPVCRHAAQPTEFNTPELDEYVAQVAQNFAAGLIDQAMEDVARGFNRSQPRNEFVKMSMSYHPGLRPIILPVQAAEAMRQKFECEECGCQYSSLGAAFFCPACGHNSAKSTFDQCIVHVRNTLATLDAIASTIAEGIDDDAATTFLRVTQESLLCRLVSAFQRLAETQFDQLPNRSQFKPRRNVFQNLPESSDLWQQAGKRRYDDILNERDHGDLVTLFQQRHLLEHREGIVDQAYLDNSGDVTYAIGQKLVISKARVERLTDLVESLATELRK